MGSVNDLMLSIKDRVDRGNSLSLVSVESGYGFHLVNPEEEQVFSDYLKMFIILNGRYPVVRSVNMPDKIQITFEEEDNINPEEVCILNTPMLLTKCIFKFCSHPAVAERVLAVYEEYNSKNPGVIDEIKANLSGDDIDFFGRVECVKKLLSCRFSFMSTLAASRLIDLLLYNKGKGVDITALVNLIEPTFSRYLKKNYICISVVDFMEKRLALPTDKSRAGMGALLVSGAVLWFLYCSTAPKGFFIEEFENWCFKVPFLVFGDGTLDDSYKEELDYCGFRRFCNDLGFLSGAIDESFGPDMEELTRVYVKGVFQFMYNYVEERIKKHGKLLLYDVSELFTLANGQARCTFYANGEEKLCVCDVSDIATDIHYRLGATFPYTYFPIDITVETFLRSAVDAVLGVSTAMDITDGVFEEGDIAYFDEDITYDDETYIICGYPSELFYLFAVNLVNYSVNSNNNNLTSVELNFKGCDEQEVAKSVVEPVKDNSIELLKKSYESRLDKKDKAILDLERESARLLKEIEKLKANQSASEEAAANVLEVDFGESASAISVDEKIAFINSLGKSYLYVGGHHKSNANLSKIINNITFVSNESFDEKLLSSKDVCIFNASFSAHKLWYKVQRFTEKFNTPLISVNGTNIEKIVCEIYDALS